ncbi:hypothetical protein FB45DRAFT_918719 [Roridomyces roridus]|uniref:Uncharacterized protein n=1 Tax=Roridomyces roridus TaxID=1738132 RepID=A0AAD7FMD7_9AGAR|nr:hypothetical protein FB45DRAFT_918719 [Roridomyces roridus]
MLQGAFRSQKLFCKLLRMARNARKTLASLDGLLFGMFKTLTIPNMIMSDRSACCGFVVVGYAVFGLTGHVSCPRGTHQRDR